MNKIYMDYAASTPVDKNVKEAMDKFHTKHFGNPSSVHSYGTTARKNIENSRHKVSELIEADENEIVFTSGGTESDNLAIKGISFLNKDKRKNKENHIITSSIEHPAVLKTCKHLEKLGFNVKYLPVDKYGLIDPKDLEKAISDSTFLITIMYANNEVGTIQPIKKIGKIAKEHDIIFHTDAVQAIGKIPIDVNKLNIDMLSISAHKIYGPKGVGALYINNDINEIQPLLHGGEHEKGIRSGTYNTPGIIGLGKACELAQKRIEKDTKLLKNMRDQLIENILNIKESYLNGHPKKRLVNNAHFRFTAIEGESLIMMLDDKGIAAATGSACSSEKLEPSHVLTAMGIKPEEAHGSLRLTLGRHNTEEDINYATEIIPKVVSRLREISPLWH